MSKKCKKQTAKYVQRTEKNSCAEKIVKNQTYYDPALDTIVGTSNVSQWNELKDAFCCKTNVEFATVLLNLAEEQLNNRLVENNSILSGFFKMIDVPTCLMLGAESI